MLCSDHLILLDEPFSGLDVAMIDEVKKIIVEVTNMDELNTVLIVSHDIATTTALADRLWLLAPSATQPPANCCPAPPLAPPPVQPGPAWPSLAPRRGGRTRVCPVCGGD
ncbi:hypothetical protein [Hymenobacter sp. BRD67]|uniref:hypothetical protein n=1 Tax=Hymenobacter sp. BRD67 TaxID=2675877 RepID=UPI0020B746CF|nr:hypothetical protein [Hymenobacter sp. BRD67]